jgi:DNA-binding response OmpR family regulator
MEFRPRVVLLDGLLPYMHGFDVVRYLRSVVPDYRPEYLFMTAIYRNNSYRNEAKLNLGISRYLVKPFSDSQLIAEMDSAWRASREQLAPQMVQLRAAV